MLQPRNRQRDYADTNDVLYALERADTHGARPIAIEPAPITIYETGEHKGKEKINPHVTRFYNDDGTITDVFHVKPIYYLHVDGSWRPMREIADYQGNRRIDLKEDWADSLDIRYLAWLLKRMELIGGNVSIPSPYAPKTIPLTRDRVAGGAQIMFTTSTFYPDPHTESTSVDGYAGATGSQTWASIRGAAGNEASDAGNADCCVILRSSSTTNEWDLERRLITLFDTSAIDDTDTITAATYSLYILNSPVAFADVYVDSASLVTSAPASNTQVVSGDYDSLGATKQASDVTLASIGLLAVAGGYADWTLNGTGLGNISKTAVTKFGLRLTSDCDNVEPTWAAGDQRSQFSQAMAEATGTTTDPKLVVTHSGSTAYTQDLDETITLVETQIKQTGKAIPETVTLVDTITRAISKAFADVVTLVDDASTSFVFTRAFTDEITLSDTLTRTAGKLVTDVVTLVDTATRTVTKALTDVVTLVVDIANEVTVVRIFNETITIVDNVAKKATKVLSEVITVVDTLAKRLSAMLLTEVITLDVSIANLRTQFKTLTEQLVLVATLTKVGTFARALTETVTLRARAFANGISLQWLNKYASKVGSWLDKYDDPK